MEFHSVSPLPGGHDFYFISEACVGLFFSLSQYLWLKKKSGLLPVKFANGIAFNPSYKTSSLQSINMEKCHKQKCPFLGMFCVLRQNY